MSAGSAGEPVLAALPLARAAELVTRLERPGERRATRICWEDGQPGSRRRVVHGCERRYAR
jgi:hypothetical protein